VHDVPILVRHPEGIGAGKRSDMIVQHTDISALILEMAGVEPKSPIDGISFWKAAVEDGEPIRDHVTIGWGSAMTVIDENWWMNCKINGRGVFLYDLNSDNPFENNVADGNKDVARQLFEKGVADAGNKFPDFVIKMAEGQADAPGCSDLAARE
jgi:arylsulfatase A-like enzyme